MPSMMVRRLIPDVGRPGGLLRAKAILSRSEARMDFAVPCRGRREIPEQVGDDEVPGQAGDDGRINGRIVSYFDLLTYICGPIR